MGTSISVRQFRTLNNCRFRRISRTPTFTYTHTDGTIHISTLAKGCSGERNEVELATSSTHVQRAFTFTFARARTGKERERERAREGSGKETSSGAKTLIIGGIARVYLCAINRGAARVDVDL